ncbi:MAG: transposase [Candidatus Sulfotelmatobacter sp.]
MKQQSSARPRRLIHPRRQSQLTRFVRTSQQDLGAVEAAVTEPWSNGPVEGHINRLKTLKRQMYGRAGVKLLRARLLPEAIITGQCVHQS